MWNYIIENVIENFFNFIMYFLNVIFCSIFNVIVNYFRYFYGNKMNFIFFYYNLVYVVYDVRLSNVILKNIIEEMIVIL